MIRTLALLAGPALSIALVMLFGIKILFGCVALVLLAVPLSCAKSGVAPMPTSESSVDDQVHTLI